MNRTFFEELPARKVAGPVVAAKKKEGEGGGGAEGGEASAKKVRQAVYDIRYRARREDVELQAAYNQYMSNTTMTAPEKAEVKKKLFGEGFISNYLKSKKLDEATKGEGADKKYKVRVTDKATGRTYVRYADRAKINALRANPAISSVEMTDHGDAYEGEPKKGGDEKKEAPKEDKKEKKEDVKEGTCKYCGGKGCDKCKKKMKKEALDPVGQEDGDIDNDGDVDKSDKYLHKKRKAIGKAIAKRTKKEEAQFYNWREEFFHEMGGEVDPETEKKVTEKKVNNKITINPKLGEAKNGGDNDPCWDSHKQVGMKKKGGKMVPNCVPKEEVELQEKNVPTNPALWSKMKSRAKAKFDVYPSAYANGWAAKQYKAAGGGWKSA
tara:strand:+ start:2681 stop:3820 length:1140 start_codon:yes stop_codon:yes gene_type:complete